MGEAAADLEAETKIHVAADIKILEEEVKITNQDKISTDHPLNSTNFNNHKPLHTLASHHQIGALDTLMDHLLIHATCTGNTDPQPNSADHHLPAPGSMF